ncbi:hypothetical protein FQN57_003397 [Myotisia sp. PD_48]|nr:hypothetical protein FQN57_003397 [Myotisia sp. PD_48]
MAVPPERIRIKRRRDDEPVETLLIQSEVHQPKRRFTDYVFQRIVRDENGADITNKKDPGLLSPEKSPAKGVRSVSAAVASPSKGSEPRRTDASGVPVLITPQLRAQIKGRPTPSRDGAEQNQQQKPSSSANTSPLKPKVVSRPPSRGTGSGVLKGPSTVRRFHIAPIPATSDEDGTLGVLRKVGGGGIQKKKPARSQPVVVVEKTSMTRSNSKASSIITKKAGTNVPRPGGSSASSETSAASASPKKRHVVNHAENHRKEQGEVSRYVDRVIQTRAAENRGMLGHSANDDPSTWNQDSEQLADELSRIALEMTNDIEPSQTGQEAERPNLYLPVHSAPHVPTPYRPELKYCPRRPNYYRDPRKGKKKKGRGIFDGTSSSPEPELGDVSVEAHDVNDNDGDEDAGMMVDKITATIDPNSVLPSEMDEDEDSGYVFDEFVRRHVQDVPLDKAPFYFHDGEWLQGEDQVIPKDIGVVVITREDVHLWNELAEDEEGDWDIEDEDSNAEDNPANEYPDEDLDFDDEFNDTNAVYRRFRSNASDDEEFDAVEYDAYGYRTFTGNDSDVAESDLFLP